MIKKLLSVFTVAASLVCLNAFSQTNATVAEKPLLEQAKETVKSVASTNLNQVLIEILSGVKSAGGEVYTASKDAIHKSVDFVVEQAPDVVKQFLMWKFFHALTWMLIWISVASIVLFFAYKLRKYQDKASKDTGYNSGDPSEHNVVVIFKWILGCLACIFLLFGVSSNALQMVKIKVAPKVYIIEFVVDTIRGETPIAPRRDQ